MHEACGKVFPNYLMLWIFSTTFTMSSWLQLFNTPFCGYLLFSCPIPGCWVRCLLSYDPYRCSSCPDVLNINMFGRLSCTHQFSGYPDLQASFFTCRCIWCTEAYLRISLLRELAIPRLQWNFTILAFSIVVYHIGPILWMLPMQSHVLLCRYPTNSHVVCGQVFPLMPHSGFLSPFR